MAVYSYYRHIWKHNHSLMQQTVNLAKLWTDSNVLLYFVHFIPIMAIMTLMQNVASNPLKILELEALYVLNTNDSAF